MDKKPEHHEFHDLYIQLYDSFKNRMNKLNSLPGKYYAFSKERRGFANSHLTTKIRKPLEEAIKKSTSPDYVSPRNDFTNIPFVTKTLKWLKESKKYIEDYNSANAAHANLIIYYFNLPLHKNEIPKIKRALLKTDDENQCILYKQDFEHDRERVEYRGVYEKIGNGDILAFDLKTTTGRYINIVLEVNASNDLFNRFFGCCNHYDGQRIQAFRVIGERTIEDHPSFETDLKYNSKKHISDSLVLRSRNYISGFNRIENQFRVLGEDFENSEWKFAEAKRQLIFITTDLILDGKPQKTYQSSDPESGFAKELHDFFLESSEVLDSDSYKILLRIVFPEPSHMLEVLRNTSKFILFNNENIRIEHSLFYLHWSAIFSKKVLFIYQENSISGEHEDFLKGIHDLTQGRCSITLFSYFNFNKDSGKIRKAIQSFLKFGVL